MTEPPREEQPDAVSAPSAPGLPWWVKAFFVVLALIAIAVVLKVTLGADGHGPGMH